jgi:tripartite-type tricarboxylate transporter receptor subunit TctC
MESIMHPLMPVSGRALRARPSRSPLFRSLLAAGTVALASVCAPVLAQGGAPTKTVEFVGPAGTGGGADQMARFIQTVIAKHNLMKQPMVVVNKSGGAGAEGFLDIKGSKGDPHKIVITLSNLFTMPLATAVPFISTGAT